MGFFVGILKMHILRKGDHGPDVKMLQKLLNDHGSKISEDGYFGYKTEVAVKKFQLQKHLHSDGIVGRKTFASLGKPLPTRPPQPPIGGSAGRQGVGAFTISDSGMSFLYHREAWLGKSCYLHWPGGASGVTLGPGYDMKNRSSESIKNTMISIGLNVETAEKISKASGLQNSQASEFAKNNHNLVRLTEAQETQLLRVTVPHYVTMVKNGIFVPLRQYEFDALVSFAYNPGGRFSNVCDFINRGQVSDAMTEIKRAITSRGTVMSGLVNRRNYEVNLYLNGIYEG